MEWAKTTADLIESDSDSKPSKSEIVGQLQEHAEEDFLKQHNIHSEIAMSRIRKKVKLATLVKVLRQYHGILKERTQEE
eukprot:g4988.t1